jgi:hypothetical protein
MQQQDLLLAGHPASLERARECALRNTPAAGGHRAPETAAKIVDLSVRLRAKEREKPPGSHDQVLAEQILRTFNTWSFKREQPSDIGLMLKRLSMPSGTLNLWLSRSIGAKGRGAAWLIRTCSAWISWARSRIG